MKVPEVLHEWNEYSESTNSNPFRYSKYSRVYLAFHNIINWRIPSQDAFGAFPWAKEKAEWGEIEMRIRRTFVNLLQYSLNLHSIALPDMYSSGWILCPIGILWDGLMDSMGK